MSALFTFRSEHLPTGTRVLSFQGREAISTCYELEVFVLLAHEDSYALDLRSVVNQRATLRTHREDGSARATHHGVIAVMELLHELPGDALYRVVLVPKLSQLRQTRHSNVFVEQRLPELLEGVLLDSGLGRAEFSLRLTRHYPPLSHVCQYKESHYDFLTRWLEREGIYFFFEQAEGHEVLVLVDDKSAHPRLSPSAIAFRPQAGGVGSAVEGLVSFTCRQSSLPASVSLADYDYLQPDTELGGEATVSSHGVGAIVSFGDNVSTAAEGKRLAGVRAQALAARETVFRARGRAYGLQAGFVFELEEHPRPGFNGEYLVTELELRGNQFSIAPEARKLLGQDDEEDTFRVALAAIRGSVQFRAEARAPTPRIYGLELAVVDGGESSEYAQLDEHGRYLVKILFDERDGRNGRASTRVRMLQPHGGTTEGFHFPLRKGTEVLLVFLGGDPDRPVIAGVTPNASRPSPVTADNRTLNVLQTGGSNRLEFDDLAGKQYATLSTPTQNTFLHLGDAKDGFHFYLSTEGDGKDHTEGDRETTVGGDQSAEVLGSSNSFTLGNSSSEVVGDAVDVTVGQSTSLMIGNVTETTIASTESLCVGPVLETNVSNTTSLTVGNTVETNLSNTASLTVGDEVSVNVGNFTSMTMGNASDTTMGNAMSTVLGSTASTCLGSAASTCLGATTSLVLGASTDTVVGASTSVLVGASTSIAMASQTGICMGAATDVFMGLKVEADLAATIDIVLGLAVSVFAGVSVNATAAVKVELDVLKLSACAYECSNTPVEIESVGALISAGLKVFS